MRRLPDVPFVLSFAITGTRRDGLGRIGRADAGPVAGRLAAADRLGNELRRRARRTARRGGAGRAADLAAADRAAQRRHAEGSREPPDLPLLARVSGQLRQAIRGPGRVGRGRLLRNHAGAHPRGGVGRQAAAAGRRSCRKQRRPRASSRRTPPRLAEKSQLGGRLAARQWITTVELLPPRGYDLRSTIEKASATCASGASMRSTSPTARGPAPGLSPLVTAERILREARIEPILHFCCRDRNLIGMQADLLACAACGVRNILFVTGDPPKLGDYPHATGVFDADSIGMAAVQRRLNCGIDLGGQAIDPPTFAVIGVGLDPTALDRQRELDRFRQKVEAGAEFAITQPVFDPDALLRFLDEVERHGVPIIAGIWPLVSYRNASFMRNEVPGVVVPDAVMERMASVESREDQLAMGIQIARESVARVRDRVAGIQVSAPLGNIDAACAVIAEEEP